MNFRIYAPVKLTRAEESPCGQTFPHPYVLDYMKLIRKTTEEAGSQNVSKRERSTGLVVTVCHSLRMRPLMSKGAIQ
jgi:hypothetical protein